MSVHRKYMNSKGYFIAFEGIDGSGKSTTARNVAAELRARGYNCLLTQEHQLDRGTGRRINDILEDKAPMVSAFELQKLFVIDRNDHVENVIRPALMKGAIVLSDRYWFSTLAYGMLSEPKERFIDLHHEIMGENFIMPGRTFLLDAPPDVAMERIQKTRAIATHFEKLKKLERIRKNYQDLAKAGLGSVTIIDGTQSPEIIVASILADLEPALPKTI